MKYEYKIVEQSNTSNEGFEETLNKLGKDGWELVSAVRGRTCAICYLKKLKSFG